MKTYKFEITSLPTVEETLNRYARLGWQVHSIENRGRDGAAAVSILFERDIRCLDVTVMTRPAAVA